MTDLHNHSTPETLIAIDIAKQSHDVVIAWATGKTLSMKIRIR